MKRLSLLITIFALLAICLHATTYYVSTSGVDSNPGTISSPWLTWNHAWAVANAGDTVYFRAGTYTVNGDGTTGLNGYTSGNDGTASNPVTFSNYPGEKVVTTSTATTMFDWDKQYHRVIADAPGQHGI